jgi:hypothetical protein
VTTEIPLRLSRGLPLKLTISYYSQVKKLFTIKDNDFCLSQVKPTVPIRGNKVYFGSQFS